MGLAGKQGAEDGGGMGGLAWDVGALRAVAVAGVAAGTAGMSWVGVQHIPWHQHGEVQALQALGMLSRVPAVVAQSVPPWATLPSTTLPTIY